MLTGTGRKFRKRNLGVFYNETLKQKMEKEKTNALEMAAQTSKKRKEKA